MLTLLYRIWFALMDCITRQTAIQKALEELKAGNGEILDLLSTFTADLQLIKGLLLDDPGQASGIIFTSEVEGKITVGVSMLQLTDTQQATLSIKLVDKKGNPAQADGVPVWASSNTEVASVEPAADGLSAVVKAVGPLGAAVVSVKADADLGAGVTELAGGIDVSVAAGAATSIEVTAGTPEEQA